MYFWHDNTNKLPIKTSNNRGEGAVNENKAKWEQILCTVIISKKLVIKSDVQIFQGPIFSHDALFRGPRWMKIRCDAMEQERAQRKQS